MYMYNFLAGVGGMSALSETNKIFSFVLHCNDMERNIAPPMIFQVEDLGLVAASLNRNSHLNNRT